MSRPRVSRTVTGTPRDSSAARKAAIDSRLEPRNSEPLGLNGIRLTLKIGFSGSPPVQSFGSSRASASACS